MLSRLDPVTVERLLARLGLHETPPVSVEGLHALYRAWCRHVPFDNVLRRIHLAHGHSGPLPGFDPAVFVQTYLRYGAGGTCTPSSGGLHALLCSLGFTVERVLAMMGGEDEPLTVPNHTTLLARLDGTMYLVDTSVACEQALPLRATPTVLDDPLHPATASPAMGTWRVQWVRPFNGQRLHCQLLPSPATPSDLLQVYEATRRSGTFNSALYARLNVAGGIIVVAKAKRFAIDRIGHAQATVVLVRPVRACWSRRWAFPPSSSPSCHQTSMKSLLWVEPAHERVTRKSVTNREPTLGGECGGERASGARCSRLTAR